MSGRNRGPHHTMKGMPHMGLPPPSHESAFARGLGPVPHSVMLEEMRDAQFGMGGPRHHVAMLEDRLAAQRQEIEALLHDNQGLATIHVALRQNLEAAHFELQQMDQYASTLAPEKDTQMREMYDKAAKLEMDLRVAEGMKAEIMQVRGEIKGLTAVTEDLKGRVGVMTKDLARAKTDLEKIPTLKAEIEFVRQELQRARSAIEYEKKGYAENYEHGQVMEKKLMTMARELEKLQGEISNKNKRASAAAALGNSGTADYSSTYGNQDTGYAGNPYHMSYNMNPVQAGAQSYLQYGPGADTWSAYDKQRTQGQR